MTSARLRFIPRQQANKTWAVYDSVNGSWPITTRAAGPVKQAMDTEKEAAQEAQRLEDAT